MPTQLNPVSMFSLTERQIDFIIAHLTAARYYVHTETQYGVFLLFEDVQCWLECLQKCSDHVQSHAAAGDIAEAQMRQAAVLG